MTTTSTPAEEFRTFLQEHYKVPEVVLDAAKEASQLPEISVIEKYGEKHDVPFSDLAVTFVAALFSHHIQARLAEYQTKHKNGEHIVTTVVSKLTAVFAVDDEMLDAVVPLLEKESFSYDLFVPPSARFENVAAIFVNAVGFASLVFSYRGHGEPEGYQEALDGLLPALQGAQKGLTFGIQLGAIVEAGEVKEEVGRALSRFCFELGKAMGKHTSITATNLEDDQVRDILGAFITNAISSAMKSKTSQVVGALQEGLDSARATKDMH